MPDIVALPQDSGSVSGEFVGVLDLIHMRAILYPETTANSTKSVEDCVPDVYPLLLGGASTGVGSSTAGFLDSTSVLGLRLGCPVSGPT